MSMTQFVLSNARFGRMRTICPSCTNLRTPANKNDLCLSLKDEGDRVVWHCWHCGEAGAVRKDDNVNQSGEFMNAVAAKPIEASIIPLRQFNTLPLDEVGSAFLAGRSISEEVMAFSGLVSGAKTYRKAGHNIPSVGFVYGHKDQAYAIKWRSVDGKEFTQDGSAQTLYLADKITGSKNLVITEGEIDALSFWTAGIPAVSIPSGAIEAGLEDNASRLRFMLHHDDLLGAVENVFIATDMDAPGETTGNELARRIGKAKCWKVKFPEGCKDANATLMKHGAQGLVDAFTAAQRWPIEGVASPNDFMDKVLGLYRTGLPKGVSTGWSCLDDIFSLNAGNLVVVTGIPGHGKSTFLDALLMNAMQSNDWRVAYASFENPTDIHISKLLSQRVGMPFGLGPSARMSEAQMMTGLEWVNEHVSFLTNDGIMPTVNSLIERFEIAVRRHGVKACVVDPFNFVKLSTKKDGGIDTEAINEMLSAFKMFAQRAEITFFLVAHPSKMMGGSAEVPGGYSISGSAHFYNRADFGITVHRKGGFSEVHIWKCRFSHQGRNGVAKLCYDNKTGGYAEQLTPLSLPDDWSLDLPTEKDDDLPF